MEGSTVNIDANYAMTSTKSSVMLNYDFCMETMKGIMIMITVKKLALVILGILSIILIYFMFNNFKSHDNVDNKLNQIMSQEAIIEKERIVKQIDLLTNKWIIEEALFANRLINEVSQDNLGIIFTLSDDLNILFDGEVYKIMNIDIIHEEDLYQIYSLSSSDVRGFNDITVLTLDTEEKQSYEKIHIMIDKDFQSIYCFVHKSEYVTGFYRASLMN